MADRYFWARMKGATSSAFEPVLIEENRVWTIAADFTLALDRFDVADEIVMPNHLKQKQESN